MLVDLLQGQKVCNRPEISYSKQLNQVGIRRHHHVLILGGGNQTLLRQTAEIVGPFGSLTVLDDDVNLRQQIQKYAREKLYKARNPYSPLHPALDVRTTNQRTQTVPVHAQSITLPLPFIRDQFDAVWIATKPAWLATAYLQQLDDELLRVTKRGRMMAYLGETPQSESASDGVTLFLVCQTIQA